MKILLTGSLIFLSFGAFAIQNGTTVNWQNDYDDFVEFGCTGLVVGGNQILTAAHCKGSSLHFSDDSFISVESRQDHPDYDHYTYADVAILNLPKVADTQSVHFLSDLTQATVSIGDTLKVYGFGGNNPLAYAEYQVTRVSDAGYNTTIKATAVSSAVVTHGDSGGAWFNDLNRVVGLSHSGWQADSTATDLFYAKDFILGQVNGWHYATVLKGTGSKTVSVQSLHQNQIADSAYTTGDISITGGTCYGNNTINAFEVCTYELEVNGTGTLQLSDSEFININPKVTPPTPEPETPSNSGGGGGSMGWLSLFLLVVMKRLREYRA